MSPLDRCPTCKSNPVNARNLAVFIDGTSNKPGDEKTNVVKMWDIVSEGEDSKIQQDKLYLKGIGAYDFNGLSLLGHLGREIYSFFEMSLAWNVDKNVIQAYRWLAENHRDGDQIYLFGFSRGAYQARALAAMIHEVGLVERTEIGRSEEAYCNYRSTNPNDPETRKTAIEFKKKFCRQGVRIHFIGVWDTVSSLGLIKQDVHITTSASVTNACHFRHALALDERRVKFMPEYFSEVNAHHTRIKIPRLAHSDVQEVWFAGCHSDIGGTSRLQSNVVPDLVVDEHNRVHAGNVPLSWMKREASAQGLAFKTERLTWRPEDVDFGREESMSLMWKILEGLPIRHQVSFSGTGKHARRLHLSCPRSIIPHQHVHSSILSSDVYAPRATLRESIGIPSVPQMIPGGLWATDSPDEVATIPSDLLCDPQTVLQFLEKVSFLLTFSNEQIRMKTDPRIEEFISKQFDFARLALSVVYDVASNYSISKELVSRARSSLSAILSSPNQPYFPGTLVILKFCTRNETLRRRFIAHEEVIRALFGALERTRQSQKENLFPLAMDTFCYLIHDDDQRGNVINQLNAESALSKAGKTRLSLVLEVKAPTQLIASLKMIASLGRYQPILCRELKPTIIDLAKKGRGLVGSMAVEALVALRGPLPRDIRFSNILGYLGYTLPRSDAEGGTTSLSDATDVLPPVFQVDGSGGLHKGDRVMRELLRTIESGGAHQRTAATLTLVKIYGYSVIREFCSWNNIWDILMRQLQKEETSLLAAYALKTCLKYDTRTLDQIHRAAELVVAMIDKSWFDDAIGQVEGSEIFRGLMTFGDLKQEVMKAGVVTTLIKKLEAGERHGIRMSLICLDILDGGKQVALELTKFVSKSLAYLQDEKKKTQIKGVRVLSALAQTKVGEEAIKQHVIDIVATLLPHAGQSHLPRSQLFGPTAALYNLCRNETLRSVIKESDQYLDFKRQRRTSALYPTPDEGWENDDPQCPTEPTAEPAIIS